MFKTITRAKAIPTKPKRFRYRTRVQSRRESALHRGATNTVNVLLFFKKINNKQILREKVQECGEAAPQNSRQRLLLAMKVAAVASGWLPSGWWDRMPVHMSHTVTIIVMLIGLTLLFSGMMHSQGSNVPPSNNSSSSITPEGWQHLHDLSMRASNLAKDQAFLNIEQPSILRINSHRHSCASLSVGGENCSCHGGAYTFADVEDVEAQLLKPGNSNGVKSITLLTPNTAQGLENFKTVFGTRCSGADTLEAVVSIGNVAPGIFRGTGNAFIGFRGQITLTFAYWRRVMNAAFHLITEMRQTITSQTL